MTCAALRHLKGRFIVLDGPDGSGKSTQLGLLGEQLQSKGLDVLCTCDPGGTRIGDQISRLLKYDAKGRMAVNAEVMLFMASRAQLVDEVIRPAIQKGSVVLCDRFVSATCAYQGSSGYPVQWVLELARFATGDLWPDLTVILDVPVEVGLDRTGRRRSQRTRSEHVDQGQGHLFAGAVADRFDSRPLEYHRQVRAEFLRLPQYYPRPVQILDTTGLDVGAVNRRLVGLIMEWAQAQVKDRSGT